jgi:hypothetical protein
MKVFFPNAEGGHLERRVVHTTCVLLISQSGQTFGTLHATHKLAGIVKDRLWIITGCANSKMELALRESYARHNVKYMNDRVINNKSGHRPAEPSSVAVAATWHTLTCLLMHLVFTTRALVPSGRMVHPWVYTKSARIIQTFFLKHNKQLRRLHHSHTYQSQMDLLGLVPEAGRGTPLRSEAPSFTPSPRCYFYTHPPVLMRLTDGCIRDLNSLLITNLIPNICSIVGTDVKGKALDSNEVTSASAHVSHHQSGGSGSPGAASANSFGVFGAGAGLMSELNGLFAGRERDYSVHRALVRQGRVWADHINEPWKVLVLAGLYIIISVGFGLPIIGLLADAFLAILRAMGAPMSDGRLIFSIRYPDTIYNQPAVWAVWGLIFQLCDAVFFVYVGKNINRLLRIVNRRPYYARFGKRTIVIVDNPTVHQLLENFVSKLFSQAYSVVSVDVHGASGLDHFVHRFTHRVVRGVLIAVGRMDGRLCCLGELRCGCVAGVSPDIDVGVLPLHRAQLTCRFSDVPSGSHVAEICLLYCSVLVSSVPKCHLPVPSHSQVGGVHAAGRQAGRLHPQPRLRRRRQRARHCDHRAQPFRAQHGPGLPRRAELGKNSVRRWSHCRLLLRVCYCAICKLV